MTNESLAVEWFNQHGLSYHQWSNGPNIEYAWHAHTYHKVLFCISGSINFKVKNDTYILKAGDKLYLPMLTLHKAKVASFGVSCIEGAMHNDNAVKQIKISRFI